MTEELRRIPDLVVRRDERLAPYTSMKVGGPADVFVEPRSREALAAAWALLYELGVPALVVGNGSNLLVRDGGFRGAVVHLARLPERFEVAGEVVTVSAQTLLLRGVSEGHRHGLTGMEWASGIPGSFGGAVTMNAGCHGHETVEHVLAVEAVLPTGEIRWLPREELAYGYRASRLQAGDLAVLTVQLLWRRGDVAQGRALLRHYLELRRATQPAGNNAGSMFKNPPGAYAGQLIERVGGKGRRRGDAEISPRHANFIVNHGRATAADVLALAAWAKDEVERQLGVRLELEVEVVGAEETTP